MTSAAAYYAVAEFSMNSNTAELIRQDTEWKRINDNFIDTFPQYYLTSFVVVSGPRADVVRRVTKALAAQLSQNPTFQMVYSPATSEFAQNHALLYVDLLTLNDIVSRLADAQPFLSAVAANETLRGVIELLNDAMTTDEPLPPGLQQISNSLNVAITRALANNRKPISWRDELFPAGRLPAPLRMYTWPER